MSPKILALNESFSEDNRKVGEGGNFRLELRNKYIKQFMPPGTPTEKQWLEVCRNLDKLRKVKI